MPPPLVRRPRASAILHERLCGNKLGLTLVGVIQAAVPDLMVHHRALLGIDEARMSMPPSRLRRE